MSRVLTVREYIEPMYQMGVSIQACGKYADKDFPSLNLAVNRFYCRNMSVVDLLSKPEYAAILDYSIACVVCKNGELIIQVG